MERDGTGAEETAIGLGIDKRLMYDILKERRNLRLDTVDRILIADDTMPLRDLYPELYSVGVA